ncbi:hypothetical protein DSAG12_01149 [Promethearchaeum syntrophicum]|uniref:NADH:ubiquinone oxidoreductase-like 20kDa subunit domain-containing protein n=1 Tax=Promethearchaeum syntrophicum TaxID=2594042 RepID=A0A5B9D865_9ARCH|nr:hypothetical protein [Candidatus Prometheoarchaeum syntrophicum]QEE15324.1 F420-non-reducing hydrogenase subunit G [Candidatus Prometheoarchaeum syntrophicum]
MKIGIFQLNGCNKCFNETILLDKHIKSKNEIYRIKNSEIESWSEKELDYAVVTGYIKPENHEFLQNLSKNSKNIVGYGSCATTGGIFGLAYQNGYKISPIGKIISDAAIVDGCLGEIEELSEILQGNPLSNDSNLCKSCARKSTCEYLDEVVRQIDPQDDIESCYNDFGYMCTGYIAKACKEMCVNYGTPCRGCKPSIDRAGFRMLGMFGTLMGNIEVATEATGKGGTDKLADVDDDITRSIPDITGNFFRFNLANSVLPIGRIQSNGSILSDIFIGRPIEELPLISGCMGGNNFISITLDLIQAYENGLGDDLPVSKKTTELRNSLLSLEKDLNSALKESNIEQYETITNQIRKLAGNMNLSNLFFGGFKVPIEGSDDFEEYKKIIFENIEGDYQNGQVKYSLDNQGLVTKFEILEA